MTKPDVYPHVFDEAIALTPLDSHRFAGRTTEPYNNMVGPFGGVTAAAMLNAVMLHPERLGEPVALTINYAGPVEPGEFIIEAIPVRTNRSTQHWNLVLRQGDTIATTGTAFFAIRRETWSEQEMLAPDAPAPETLAALPTKGRRQWMGNYDFRIVNGSFNPAEPRESDNSQSLMWVRDYPRRAMDFQSLTAIGDSFFPRVFIRRQKFVPIGTVSMTLYFHTDSEELAAIGDQYVLGYATANQSRNNYSDQSAHIWSAGGQLLLSTTQIMYFKE
ncbi:MULTISPECIES: acyl-CoA thioesterase [Marinobacter]|uniref:Acyl-CoA thioesterase n=1 Tax=Marinobacter profundi TaxID=2666256 RepID=A0A2G1UK04_9GAMM|nr:MULTISPECIES: thioesterase family protein [Marinobacter]MBD3655485.1 thioesterase family protein [Marinobacter sp.]PHQ14797.1 acyl-CoA thioesterase [Marinobacter profundi]